MQGDAFPTPAIYSPRLSHIAEDLPTLPSDRYEASSANFQHLFTEIDALMNECSEVEAKEFWMATNRIKIKHSVMASMQKIESLFLDLAEEITGDPELISAISNSLFYSSQSQQSHQFGQSHQLGQSGQAIQSSHLPNFLKSSRLAN